MEVFGSTSSELELTSDGKWCMDEVHRKMEERVIISVQWSSGELSNENKDCHGRVGVHLRILAFINMQLIIVTHVRLC